MVTVLFLLGVAALAAGVGMIFLPAGIITAGVGLVALALILARGSNNSK